MKKPLVGFLAFFGILVGSYLGIGLRAQETKQQPTQLKHEVKVTLKLVQVYVTDKKGNPVLDLTKDDILLFSMKIKSRR